MTLLLVVLGYACGSVPWGLLLARRVGVDVRRSGSGNIGATNVARTAGARLGLVTLLADVLKGALPVLAAGWLAAGPSVRAATGAAAFAGHVFPVTLRFAGGKGVATALGVLVVLAPAAAGCALGAFVVSFALWRYVSAASILAALAALGAAGLLGYPLPVVLTTFGMTSIIILRHRENYRRLRSGTEPRFLLPRKQATLPK